MTDSPKSPVDPETLPYRPCVGQMVINRAGLVWAGRRADSTKDAEGSGTWWQMPQGGVEPGEDPAAAALRELFEETGIRTVIEIAEMPSWLTYELPAELIGRAWGGRYRGQKQKWFADLYASGCPSNTMPYRSNASRSYQFADDHTSTTDGTIGTSSSGANTRTRRRQLFEIERRWSTAAKRGPSYAPSP